MIDLRCIRALNITALSLILTVAPFALAMEDEQVPTDESTDAPAVCSIQALKDIFSKHGRAIILFSNVVAGGFVLKLIFEQNNEIYAVNALWQGELQDLLQNCSCIKTLQNIHGNVQQAGFFGDISSAFFATSTFGKIVSLGCHFFVGDALAPYFTMAFLVCDATGLALGITANQHLGQANNLLTSAMPSLLRDTLKLAVDKFYYLAIPAGQCAYEFFETCYDCFHFCKKELPVDEPQQELDER